MEIYLVRHGETDGNIARRHQVEHSPLTAVGIEQAHAVAEKIKQLAPTHLLTSRLVRAIETARIIGEVNNLEMETNEHFIELIRPGHLYGYHHRSFESFLFYVQWYLGRDGGAGAESYRALRERIKHAKEHLAQYPPDARVVVVSHAAFMGFFIAHLCREQALNLFQAPQTFHKIVTMPNALITKIRYEKDPQSSSCSWSVER
jgi:2,3-bisphosphoglycerate-dependent phosphoglycerate mutase